MALGWRVTHCDQDTLWTSGIIALIIHIKYHHFRNVNITSWKLLSMEWKNYPTIVITTSWKMISAGRQQPLKCYMRNMVDLFEKYNWVADEKWTDNAEHFSLFVVKRVARLPRLRRVIFQESTQVLMKSLKRIRHKSHKTTWDDYAITWASCAFETVAAARSTASSWKVTFYNAVHVFWTANTSENSNFRLRLEFKLEKELVCIICTYIVIAPSPFGPVRPANRLSNRAAN